MKYLLLFALLLASGCTSVYHWEIEAADRLCKEYGGVDHMFSAIAGEFGVTCKSGKVFDRFEMDEIEAIVTEEKQ